MPLSDAFNGPSDFIESDQVPNSFGKTYSSPFEREHDYRILKQWLRQFGLTEKEIASRVSFQWAQLKQKYYDLGKVPPVHRINGLPQTDQWGLWADMLSSYGVTDYIQQIEVRDAFSKFSKTYNFRPGDIASTMRQTANGYSEFFDNFFRQYTDSMRVGADFTDIHNDVNSLKSKVGDLTPEEATGIPEALEEILELSYSDEPSVGERSTWDMFLGEDDFGTGPPLPDDLKNYIESELRRVNNPDPLFDPSYLEREQARVDNPQPLFPEDPVQQVKGSKFLGEEELRSMMWENPGASYEEMLMKLQGNAMMTGETLEEYSTRVYGRPPEQAFKHVYDIWDQEVELKQALRRVLKAFPEDSTAARLAHRIQDSRQPPIEHNSSMSEYFEHNRMRLINDLIDDTTGWVDFKEERARLINLMDEDSTEWESGKHHETDEVPEEDGDFEEKREVLEDAETMGGERSVLEPEPLVRTTIETSVGEFSVLGLDPVDYAANRAEINRRVQAAINDGSFIERISRTPEGELFFDLGGLILGTVGGIVLGEALHNSTQMFFVGLGTALGGDPVAAPLSIMPLYGSALLDWQRRGIKASHAIGGEEPGKIMFVRGANNKWIPAIVRGDAEPSNFNNPVDFGDYTEKWDGVHRLYYETGYGLTVKNGKLAWLQPGITSQLYARTFDMKGGNQETWKPWLQYWIPKDEEQEDYRKTGLLKPLDAVPYETIYKDLGASDGFQSMVELIHYAHVNQHRMFKASKSSVDHFSGITDPYFKTHWNQEHRRNEADMPETFTGGYTWSGWQDADIASMLSWWFEVSNPDNWWQRQSKWRKASDSRDYVTNLTKYFVDDLKTQYAGLSHSTKIELDRETIERIPQTAAELSKRLREIESDRMLSEEARQFRVAQEQARFFTRHSYRIDYSGGGDFTKEFEDMLGEEFVKYKQSTYDFAQMHPDEFVTQEFREDGSRTFNIMFGQTAHTFETRINTSLGYWSLPTIKNLPALTRTSRALIEAHNQSVLPRIGGPLRKEFTKIGGVVGTVHENDPYAGMLKPKLKVSEPTKDPFEPAEPIFTKPPTTPAPQSALLAKLLSEST